MFGNGDAYERFMGRWSRKLAPLLVDFAGLPDGGEVLDIGCGTGVLTFAIAERKAGLHVMGLDRSKAYVTFAQSSNRFGDRVRFQVGDAQQLPFPNASFAAALSLLVFNFVPDPGKALREARRVVRPGGSVSAAVWDYGDGMRMLRVFWDAAVSVDAGAARHDEKLMPLCQAGRLTKLWKDGGLEDVREQPIEIRMDFRSFADYWDPFLLGQGVAGPYLTGLDRPRVDAIRTEVKKRLKVTSEEKAFSLPARVWAVRGKVGRG